MKILYLYILIILCISCKNTQGIKPSISFNLNKVDEQCGNAFMVSKAVESNSFFRNELEKYLYKVFIDSKPCEEISDDLFSRNSFTSVVLEIYSDSSFLEYSIYEYKSRWRESYINLLNYCTNKEVFYALCDSLLLKNIDDGVIAVWDKEAYKLRHLKDFNKRNNNDYYQLVQLIAVYHNSNMIEEKENAINQLRKLNSPDTEDFLNFLENKNKIDYFDFMEFVYGGM